MKVVLFCGGLGVRLREHGDSAPKPMVCIGARPILWHIMKYYAHHGHKDFVLCLGYKANVVKEYFLEYSETVSNDFMLSGGGRDVALLSNDIADWRITFADTGLHTNIGERLVAVQEYVAADEVFLATYGDCLTDAPLNLLVNDFVRSSDVASFLSVRPPYPFHLISQRDDGSVSAIESVERSGLRINGGYFMLRRAIFDYMEEGDELVVEPFRRLIRQERLRACPYDGFWAPMDTLRERQRLENLAEAGRPPWAVWQHEATSPPVAATIG